MILIRSLHYLIVYMALAALVVVMSGCRTHTRLSKFWVPDLCEEQCCTLENVAPQIADKSLQHQKRFVEHWTTGDNAIPGESGVALSRSMHVAPTRQTTAGADLQGLLDEVAIAMPVGMEASEDGDDFAAAAVTYEEFPLTLHDAIQMALTNSKVIRRDADFVSGSSDLLRTPEFAQSASDVSLRRTGYLFGQRGEAAALSDFDTQFNWTTTWNRNETIQNNTFLSGGILPGGTLVEETAAMRAEFAKNLRSGGRAGIVQTWNYAGSNRDDLLFPSAYLGDLAVELRQPLLAGAGRFFTEVAGPPSDVSQGITGVSQGLLIARAETEIAQIDVQIAATQFLADVESLYWQLSASAESVARAQQGLAEVHEARKIIEARLQADADADDLDRLVIEDLLIRAEQLVSDTRLQQSELNDRLARLLGITSGVKPRIVAMETVKSVPITLDIDSLTALAKSRRVELNRQQRRIRTIDLQIRAAQSLLLPQLDVIARYQLNGFGDHLLAEPVAGPDEDVQSAYHNLFDNKHTGWQMGFQFSHTFGRRLARTRLANLRLQARKERTILHQQMHEIEREVAFAARRVEAQERNAHLARRRVKLITQRLDASEKRYEANDEQMDITTIAEVQLNKIEAQVNLDQAVGSYAESMVRMQQSIGRTLDENGIRVSANRKQ